MLKYILIDGIWNKHDNSYRFLLPKKNIITLHSVEIVEQSRWNEYNIDTFDEYSLIKEAQFIGCDLCHETLTTFSIEMHNYDLTFNKIIDGFPPVCRQRLPFFFSKANGGFPMVASPYYEIGIDIQFYYRDSSRPIQLGIYATIEPDDDKFNELVQSSIEKPLLLTWPNSTCIKKKLVDNQIEQYISTSDNIVAIVFRLKDTGNIGVHTNHVKNIKCFIDSELQFDLSGEYLSKITPRLFNSPFRQDGYIMMYSFIPDLKNIVVPKVHHDASYKAMTLKLEIDSHNLADSVDLMCIRYLDTGFEGGVFCLSHGSQIEKSTL